MIALISDFGLEDHFVGHIKGVIHSIAPQERVMDISHGVPPHFIPAASFVLEKSIPYFPPGTIYIVAVDPGVGTSRKILIASHNRCLFIAPDNGILTPILKEGEDIEVRTLEAEHIYLTKEPSTFEARDRMAPAAAHIAHGINWQFLGERTSDFVLLPDYFPGKKSKKEISGMVVYIDRFGNLISNIPAEMIAAAMAESGQQTFKAKLEAGEVVELRAAYAGVAGKPFMIFGSHGNLEIALTQTSAAKKLKVTLGQPLSVLMH